MSYPARAEGLVNTITQSARVVEYTDFFFAKGWDPRTYTHTHNEYPDGDIKQSDGEVLVVLSGTQSTPLLPSFPDSLWPGLVMPNRFLSMVQIELNVELMLNWITWNRTFWHLNGVLMLNGIVWNRTVFDIETVYLY